jgi:hypothetical protein
LISSTSATDCDITDVISRKIKVFIIFPPNFHSQTQKKTDGF